MIRYKVAETEEDFDLVRELFLEYFSLYREYLGNQDLKKELQDIPGKYAFPNGCLILAIDMNNLAVGCVGIKKFDDTACEMGRLYVKPKYRKRCIGYMLVEMFIKEAVKIGYKRLLLDTVPELKSAIKLYKQFGFKEISPYYNSPIKNPIYMELSV